MAKTALVLGAGIVGVSVAVHLQRRGFAVTLVDRRGAGEETSYGNAGLIQREGVVPYGFPREIGLLIRYMLNNRIDAHYHATALPAAAPFLLRYWWNSAPERHKAIARAYAPLIENSISEHRDLIEASGAEALVGKRGWQKAFRTAKVRDEELAQAELWRQEFGVSYEALDDRALAAAEPHIRPGFIGALRWTDPWTVLSPLSLTQAYLKLFESLGGRFVTGDASTLKKTATGWMIDTAEGKAEAEQAVVALGPWAEAITRSLGYRLPLGIKRGYHMHYAAEGNAVLNDWTMDAERGYFLAPMTQGIRLTTGAEFADLGAPKSPVQLDRAEKVARTVFPLGRRLDPEPWMGARPCTPDMMPVIGKAPRHEGLWFSFGHAHHGLTLGPVTGRILAEMMAGETPFIDPAPFRPERFGA
ncbi:NAD(P)/FAD-dependent oxidoreductase [Gellertiella hungarica]|uniref:D-amino-acid dehydrogenase n=1 Tax=Gellertiella hungarica TaxID=1572859 RepID=A0A7W6J3N9_9HYPH|nr:FAD-binding oxidoreductase [Gellertiella hungarica]MBB4064199.1 D-amino-acid dehydrogenase [Gellertiella hungarica]